MLKDLVFLSRFTMTFNPSDIKFEEPIQHQILPLGRPYYMQALKCQGNDLIISSDWFLSNGITFNQFDNKPELKVHKCENVVSTLRLVENVAIQQLKLPSNYNYSGPSEAIFKYHAQASSLFFKLTQDCVYFDENKEIIKENNLGYGNYRVIFKINGIYIGQHGSTPYLASLQVRIIQVQYKAFKPPCFFDLVPPIPQTQEALPAEVNCPEIIQDVQPKPATKKKGGRPKLTRLSSVLDSRQDQNKEPNPAEVDTDVDMDSTVQ